MKRHLHTFWSSCIRRVSMCAVTGIGTIGGCMEIHDLAFGGQSLDSKNSYVHK